MRGASKEETKQALRTAALSQRNSLSRAESLLRSRVIQAKALELPHYFACRSVALYSAVQNEVCTNDILTHALKIGKKVFYPRVGQDNSVAFFQVLSAAELHVDRFGIPAPARVTLLSEPEYEGLMVFVPGVAFDQQGNRLGRGQGWYDRLLKQVGQKPTVAALAYEFQIVEAVPTDLWDQRVHYVITERRVINCATVAAQSS